MPVVAVTGASRGIGRAVVIEFARRGYRVFALARSMDELAALAAGIPGITPVAVDVADDSSRERAVAQIMAATDGYGVDALVNNAGYGRLGPVEEVSVNDLRRQFEVNLFGAHDLTRSFVPAMRARGHGRIINVSSIAGRVSTPFMGAYSASKFALEALSDALRLELTPFNVQVVLIEPGPVRTAFGSAAVTLDDPASPYAPYIRGQQSAKRFSDIFTRSAESVARLIVRAAEVRNPRARYTITVSAKVGTLAHHLMPDVVQDWALRRSMQLRSPRARERH